MSKGLERRTERQPVPSRRCFLGMWPSASTTATPPSPRSTREKGGRDRVYEGGAGREDDRLCCEIGGGRDRIHDDGSGRWRDGMKLCCHCCHA